MEAWCFINWEALWWAHQVENKEQQVQATGLTANKSRSFKSLLCSVVRLLKGLRIDCRTGCKKHPVPSLTTTWRPSWNGKDIYIYISFFFIVWLNERNLFTITSLWDSWRCDVVCLQLHMGKKRKVKWQPRVCFWKKNMQMIEADFYTRLCIQEISRCVVFQ